jgi:hypothetical protein
VKNISNRKKIHNIFLDIITLIASFLYGIIKSVKIFLFGIQVETNKKTKAYSLIHFIVYQWPRKFFKSPSGYSLTRYIGDLLHHMFLKK